MIRAAVPTAQRARVHVIPLRDRYKQTVWAAALRETVDAVLGSRGSRTLIGRLTSELQDCLSELPDWGWRSVEPVAGVDASRVLDTLFGADADDPERMLIRVADVLPASTVDFLRDWMAKRGSEQLRPEWQMLRDYKSSWACAPHPPVLFTVDCVVRCRDHVLLIRRAHAPGKGLIGVPGGFMEERETARQTAERELEEETHLDVPSTSLRACLKSTALFDRPGRSSRGRTLTHVHFFDLGDRPLPAIRADDDAAEVQWLPIDALPPLEGEFLEDHFQMLDHFLGLQLPNLPLPALDIDQG
jgi:bifunctional NMN adenylyltransferase/nudix hydrolase